MKLDRQQNCRVRRIGSGFILSFSLLFYLMFIVGCSQDSETFYYPVLGFNEPRILISNSIVSPASHTVTMYDMEGNLLRIVSDRTIDGMYFRSIAFFDAFHVVVSTDSPDQLQKLNFLTGKLTTLAAHALLGGNMYDVVRQAEGVYLVAETSTVEKFVNGDRVPAAGNPYIVATTGACVISAGRGMAINSAGELIVVSATGNQLNRYDISTAVATCEGTNASFGANQPIPVVAHPDGKIYFGTQTNDTIYSLPEQFVIGDVATVVVSGNGSINNPSALAVLPNGNLLVFSDGIDTIIEMQTDGTIVNSSFIKNAFTSSVTAIHIVESQ